MNFKALRAFQLIAERGSLAAAAGDLCLSQPAISRLIAQLENELDLRLFNRTGRGLSMTKEGKLFYDTTKHILAGVEDIPRIAREIQFGDRNLKLLTTPRIAQSVVSPALALLREGTPNLRFRVDVQSSIDIENSIGSNLFDLAITAIPAALPSRDIRIEPVFKVRIEALLPKGHRLLARHQLTAADLTDEELIGPWHDESWRQQMSEFLPPSAGAAKYAVETQSALMACQMASHGAGIAFFDRLSARGLDLHGAEFRPMEPQRWITFGCVHPRGEMLGSNANAFIDALHKTIEDFRSLNPANSATVEIVARK